LRGKCERLFEISSSFSFLTLTLCLRTRSLFCLYVHSLPRGKERTKKTDFGKPKSQVCLFAGANIALRAGANIARQRLLPLETAPPAVLKKRTAERECLGKTPPSWAHKRTPKMG